MGWFSWLLGSGDPYPDDTDQDGTLDKSETKALLSTKEDNSLKALIRVQNAHSMTQGIIKGVGEYKFCSVDKAAKDAGEFGAVVQFFAGSTHQQYENALNQYLQTIKSDEGYGQYQAALKISGIESRDEFAGLEKIELPDNFCALRKANPDSPKR